MFQIGEPKECPNCGRMTLLTNCICMFYTMDEETKEPTEETEAVETAPEEAVEPEETVDEETPE